MHKRKTDSDRRNAQAYGVSNLKMDFWRDFKMKSTFRCLDSALYGYGKSLMDFRYVSPYLILPVLNKLLHDVWAIGLKIESSNDKNSMI